MMGEKTIKLRRETSIRRKALRKWLELLEIDDSDETLKRFGDMMSVYSNKELVKPLIAFDLKNGVFRKIIQDRYETTTNIIRGVGVQIGIFKPNKNYVRENSLVKGVDS